MKLWIFLTFNLSLIFSVNAFALDCPDNLKLKVGPFKSERHVTGTTYKSNFVKQMKEFASKKLQKKNHDLEFVSRNRRGQVVSCTYANSAAEFSVIFTERRGKTSMRIVKAYSTESDDSDLQIYEARLAQMRRT